MGGATRVLVVNLLFSLVVSLSFCLYAMTFQRVKGMAISDLGSAVRFGMKVVFDPYFMAGLALALAGSILRVVLMRWLDVSRTALASEISLVMMLGFSYLFFGTKLRFPQDYLGAALILAGSYLVAR